MPQPNDCPACGAAPQYFLAKATDKEPAEHQIVCTKCRRETQVHRYSTDAVKEWNRKAHRK